MNILVIGGTGLLGTAILKAKKPKKFLLKISSRTKNKNNIINLDLTSISKTTIIFKKVKPDVIINCSALTNVSECNKSLKKAILNNSNTVKNIVHSSLNLKKKPHIIHISTDQVYNNKYILKKNTENNVRVSNNYSKSKYLGEKILLKYKKKTIIRTNFFGKSQSLTKSSFSDYLISNFKKNKSVKLPSNIYFSPIIMSELVKNIFKIVDLKTYGTYNIGSSNGISKYDFGILITKLFKYSPKLIVPYLSNLKDFNRPSGTIMNIKKIEKKLKIKLPSINESILMLEK